MHYVLGGPAGAAKPCGLSGFAHSCQPVSQPGFGSSYRFLIRQRHWHEIDSMQLIREIAVVREAVGPISIACVLFCLSGCGGGGGDGGGGPGPTEVETHILSDPSADGDIEQTPTSYVVTQGMQGSVQSVLSGIDPSSGDEFRAFLDFPLGGPGGIPGDAIIDSASLTVMVDNLAPPDSGLPVRVELVSFQPPVLTPTQFDLGAEPSLGAVLVPGDVTGADIGHDVTVDVTPLMIQAQNLGLPDLQLRIMEDLGIQYDVLMEIDDTIGPGRPQSAPELAVTYH